RAQEAALSSAPFPVTWHSDFDEVPDDAPLILVANEYLDTRSVDQVIEDGGTSRPRLIGLDAKGQLQFTGPGGIAADEPNPATVWERPAEPCRLIDALARRVAHPVAGLLIDYGHDTTLAGETLQAVRGHKFEHILTSPGEADLSAHVDFAHFAGICGTLGLDVDGPLPQAEFLGNLGALQRASRLMSANPARAMEIETGMLRLMSPTGMGGHFKVIGVRDPALPPLPGFPDAMA
ncbi:MAG TPA: SAM-dependent methyltransferase, partial [Hyphomicrobiaceae bacterium]|nr:SAM-dependent methyltransferase [Hyphomicrobiaceae bacterium]